MNVNGPLYELAAKFSTALTVQDVFGSDVDASYRQMAAACHPDKWHGTPNADRAQELFKLLSQWKEMAEKPPVILESEKRAYQLHTNIGVGDLCDVYYATSDNERFVLKIPRVPNAQNLMAKEREVLEQLREKSAGYHYHNYYPPLVESFTTMRAHEGRVNVFDWCEGLYSAESIRKRYAALDGKHIGWMFNRLLVAIGFAHQQGWIHGAVVPPHLLFSVKDHGLRLVDWIHAVQIGKVLSIIPAKFRDWYPPEVIAKKPVTPAVDIYMAAKAAFWLSGDYVATLPIKMQGFLRACLMDSPGMRGVDAWELQTEWSKLLESLYGRPQFHELKM